MSVVSIGPVAGALSLGPGTEKEQLKQAGAAKDFESILVAQLFQSFRESESSWMGGGDDAASGTAFALGEQQLAKTISSGGGFGISRVIEAALRKTTVGTDTTR